MRGRAARGHFWKRSLGFPRRLAAPDPSPYIPRNGILLTQDPIGLAGGVNLYAYAGNNPVAFSDPFGLTPWGKLVTRGIRGFKWISKKVSREALDEAVTSGDDVIMSSRREALDLAQRHSDAGRRPIGPERSPGEGNRPHYHPNPRNGSHIFFSIAAGLTVSNYVGDDAPRIVKAGATVADLFNPLSVLNDGVEIYRELAGEPPSSPPRDEQ